MSEISEKAFDNLYRDVKEIKAALIGSDQFGQKGLVQRMSDVENETVQNRKRTYENGENIRHLDKDIKNVKKTSAGLGAGGGVSVAALIEALRSIFT